MARKNPARSQKKRSQRKVLDAFHLAERAAGAGADSDDASGDDLHVRDGIMDARKFLKNHGDSHADSALDDDDLDSDDALTLDDDFDVLSSKFSHTLRAQHKARRGAPQTQPALDSDSDAADHSVDEAELVPLSEAWAMDDRDLAAALRTRDVVLDDRWDSESGSESGSGSELGSGSGPESGSKSGPKSRSKSDSESGSGSDSSSDSGSDSSSDSESGSESDDAMLRGSGSDAEPDLAATTRTVQRAVGAVPRHRRLVAETIAENEHSVPTRGGQLRLADMVAAGSAGAAPLVATDAADAAAATLAVPLPKHVQDRNDRRVAYELSRQDVARWQESVRALQAADHVTFPLPPPAAADQQEMDAEAQVDLLRAVPEPEQKSALAQRVDGVLRAGALLDETNEATFEQLAAARLSKDDVLRRTQELRRMRELMFRDEQRAKRIKKIKSKQFRKIRKKERLRDADAMAGLAESEPEDHDMRRAEERMSLRHKTQSGWARNLVRAGLSKDAASRAELEEMLRAGERLRARQMGHADGEPSDADVSDVERDYAADDAAAAADASARGRLGKGVLAMDFMTAAAAKQRRANEREMAFVRSMGETGIELFGQPADSVNQLHNQGRRVYAPAAVALREALADVEDDTLRDFRDDDAKSLDARLAGRLPRAAADGPVLDSADGPLPKRLRVEEHEFTGFADGPGSTVQAGNGDGDGSDNGNGSDGDGNGSETNPWLATAAAVPKSQKYSTVTEDSSRLDKAAHKIAKRSGKKAAGAAREPDTYIDLDKVMSIGGNVMGSEDEDDQADTRMFRQQNLILEAFAGDDVVAAFRAEKTQVEDAEADREEDATLPGWGGWGGAGARGKPKKKFVRKVDGVAQKDQRKDRGLDNVIVNESVNKHNLKYQSLSVPFPYESREQYERALRMPVGEEWASRATHQKTILPRVEVKQGVVIDPMKAPFK